MTERSQLLKAVIICFSIFISGLSASAEVTVLKFAGLVDGTGELLAQRELLIEGELITEIGDHLIDKYPDARLITLNNLVAIPGIIDVHVHMAYGLQGHSRGDAWTELMATPASERLVAATRHARQMLQIGVTTARDLTAFEGEDFDLKALIDSKIIPGPRLFISGAGIHPLFLPPVNEVKRRGLVSIFSEIARQRAGAGADWLKIFATTGSADDLSDTQNFRYPEIVAATEIAHSEGLKVAVHSYGPSAVRDSLKAGVDSIEHATGMDDELLDIWSKTKTVYVPTIDHNRYYKDHRDEYGYDEVVAQNLMEFVDRNTATLRRAHEAGISIAMGSDAVMSMFGQNTRELEWFVKAGMTPAEAIQAATVNGAHLLGQGHFLGRLKIGYAADIVGVTGNPLDDIRSVSQNVTWVMKAGDIVVGDIVVGDIVVGDIVDLDTENRN